MRIALLTLLCLVGCAAPKIDLNANKMKKQQNQRVNAANKNVQEQTGTDLGKAKPQKRKFGMPTAPVDP
jgi:hypothetical protein